MIIDNYHGLLKCDEYIIDFKDILSLLGIVSNKEDLTTKLINNTMVSFEKDREYIVRPYSNLGLKKRLEGKQGEKRYNNIFFTPSAFKQFILQSDSENARILCDYFMAMESIQVEYMRKDIANTGADFEMRMKRQKRKLKSQL